MRLRWIAFSIAPLALAALTACSSPKSASIQLSEIEAEAQAELDTQCAQARAAWDSAVTQKTEELASLSEPLKNALLEGDAEWISSHATPVLREQITLSTLSPEAWNGIEEVRVDPLLDTDPFPECPKVTLLSAEVPEDLTMEEATGGVEYVPRVDGQYWTEYVFPTFDADTDAKFAIRGTDVQACIPVSLINGEPTLMAEDEGPGDCAFLEAMTIRDNFQERNLAGFKFGETSLPEAAESVSWTLPGTYTITAPADFPSPWVELNQPLDSVTFDSEPLKLVAGTEVIEMARAAADEWIQAGLAATPESPWCPSRIGEVLGEKTFLPKWACDTSHDASQLEIDQWDPDVMTGASLAYEDLPGQVEVRFFSEKPGPVLTMRQKGGDAIYLNNTDIVVTYTLRGNDKPTPAPGFDFIFAY